MNTTYEVTDLFEVGEAGSLIQAKQSMETDEVSGAFGPLADVLEDE